MKSDVIKQSWFQMTSIQVGGAICLPILMVGQVLGSQHGFASGIFAILVGNALLFFLGMLKAKMSFENGKVTIENAELYFGKIGKFILGLNMIISLIGWFAIQLNLISLSIVEYLQIMGVVYAIPRQLINLVLGVCITYGTLSGINGLERLSSLSLPIMLFVMGRGIFNVIAHSDSLPNVGSFSMDGLSLVIAAALLAVIDIPTYYQYSRSKADSYLSIFLSFAVALPIIEFIGLLLTVNTQGVNLLQVLTADSGLAYQLFVLAFLVLAGWTTNNANVFSAGITLKSITRMSLSDSMLVLGIVGTTLSFLDLLVHFEAVLNAMGIFVSAMGSVIAIGYVMRQIFCRQMGNPSFNFLAWVLGVIVGFMSMLNIIHLTGFELLDSFVVAGIVCFVLNVLREI